MVNEIGAQQHQLVVTFLGLPQSPCRVIADKIGRRPVTCEDLGRDRYKRIIATCTVAGEDLERWMVANGWALAYRRYSLDYVDEEAAAQAGRSRVLTPQSSRLLKPIELYQWRYPRSPGLVCVAQAAIRFQRTK